MPETEEIPGWFNPADKALFEFFLDVADGSREGDLVELGTYLGKSAAFMGAYLRPDETFTVCDLFEEATDDANAAENAKSYASLNRQAFEQNYRAVRGDLPVIVEGPSALITKHVSPSSARFVHVDASHLYEHVMIDIDSAEEMLKPGGVVVFDDYRSPHTPGVAAAVWGAVAQGRITPVCLTRMKLYATVGDGGTYRARLLDWLPAQSALRWEVQRLAGTDIVRVSLASKPRSQAKPVRPKKSRPDVSKQLARINRRLIRIEDKVSAPPSSSPARRVLQRLRSVPRGRAAVREEHRVDEAG